MNKDKSSMALKIYVYNPLLLMLAPRLDNDYHNSKNKSYQLNESAKLCHMGLIFNE